MCLLGFSWDKDKKNERVELTFDPLSFFTYYILLSNQFYINSQLAF